MRKYERVAKLLDIVSIQLDHIHNVLEPIVGTDVLTDIYKPNAVSAQKSVELIRRYLQKVCEELVAGDEVETTTA